MDVINKEIMCTSEEIIGSGYCIWFKQLFQSYYLIYLCWGFFCVAVYLCFKLFWYNIVIKCRLRVFLWLYYTKRHRILVERINLSLWSRTHCMHILFWGFSVYLLLIRRLFFFLSSCHSKCIYSGINMDKEAKQATSFRWFTF